MNVYEAVYNCPEHGDFSRPVTTSGNEADKIHCPKCHKEIPLVRTTPFRDDITFGGAFRTK